MVVGLKQIVKDQGPSMGWDILRLWVYEVLDRHADCVTRVKRWVEEALSLPDEVNSIHAGLDE